MANSGYKREFDNRDYCNKCNDPIDFGVCLNCDESHFALLVQDRDRIGALRKPVTIPKITKDVRCSEEE